MVTVDMLQKTHISICDQLDQNPPVTHTMAKNSFHYQRIAPLINELITSIPLPKVNRFAFAEACF